jgi:hypothetical protein
MVIVIVMVIMMVFAHLRARDDVGVTIAHGGFYLQTGFARVGPVAVKIQRSKKKNGCGKSGELEVGEKGRERRGEGGVRV